MELKHELMQVEVRDWPRTGSLVPGRDGPGLWPDGRVVGTSSPPPSPPSLGNWGLKQFQFSGLNRSHMRDLGSSVGASCMKFRRASFFEKSKNIENPYFQYFQDIRKFQETCSKNNPRQHNTTPGAARPPPPARRPYFQDTRQSEKPDFQYLQATRKLENFNFQYFQANRKLEKPDLQYFQAARKLEKSNFQYFQATRESEKSNFQYFQATRKSEKPDFQYFQDMRKYNT